MFQLIILVFSLIFFSDPAAGDYMSYIYTPAYCKSAYFVGAFLGYILYTSRNRKLRIPKVGKLFASFSYLLD